ncbi:uncharacterized protein [Eucyclogobius newberryi]|uniref:uncharacterized protein isoform X2 n=1 Tax=Eucyclogobius newberryi TaxID=166745 RepID=UPI003B58DC4C
MKLTVFLCVTFVLVNCPIILAKKKGGLLDTILNRNKNPKPNPNKFNQGGSVHKQDTPGSHVNPRPQQPAPGYPGGAQGGTGGHGGGYPAQGGGYPAQGGGYPAQGGGYPAQGGGYPAQGGGYPAQGGGYPAQGGGHPAQGGGYPAQGGGHPAQGGGYPAQGGSYPAQGGGYPAQGGRYPAQGGGYPAQGGGYPAQGGGYPGRGYGTQGGYGGQGGYGSYGTGGHGGGYPGGYINQNPNNHILSPHYGGSFGYSGYAAGGSPFARSAQAIGYVPSEKSKGFGRKAVMAAAGGAVAGMALGYGLGRFPRPHFNFHSPEEEYYYNYYMYKRYGLKSSDANDFSRDYSYKAPPDSYETFMNTCMKRKDLLPIPKKSRPTTTKTPSITTSTLTTSSVPPSHPSNTMRTANHSRSTAPTTSGPPKLSEATNGTSGAPAAMGVRKTAEDEDDDTVSVVEIGYPALIEQLKVRRCLELYIVYSEKYLRKNTTPSPRGGGQQETGSHWMIFVTSIVMIMNSRVSLVL